MTIQMIEWLQGKKTYIMILVDCVDQIGVQNGYWEANAIRHIVEFTFTAGFLRAGIDNAAMKAATAVAVPTPEK